MDYSMLFVIENNDLNPFRTKAQDILPIEQHEDTSRNIVISNVRQ